MADPVVTPEHGGLAALFTAVGAFVARYLPRRRLAEGESRLERELREVRAQVVDQKLAALEQRCDARLAELQRELGRQEERIRVLEKDVDNLWRRHRGEEPR